MQEKQTLPGVTLITPTANIRTAAHGGRAKCLQRLVRLGLPVPRTEAIDFDTVAEIAAGRPVDTTALLAGFEDGLVSVRPSSGAPDWGGPTTILNVGMTSSRHADLTKAIGAASADALYARFIRAYAVNIARLDPDAFEGVEEIDRLLNIYATEMDEEFPQDPGRQLAMVLRSMAHVWDGVTARLLRQARGAPADAGLGLVVQAMALGCGDPNRGESGSGLIQFVDPETGRPRVTGRYLSQSQGSEAPMRGAGALCLTRDPRGPSLEDRCPDIYARLQDYGTLCRNRLREEMQIEFTIHHDRLHILDAIRVRRSARAGVQIAVALATDAIISESEAVLRVQPRALLDLLHRQVDPEAQVETLCTGIAASPGAATGQVVFTAAAAQASAAREQPCILVRRETHPGDVNGMYAAAAVLTERGGATSHAAVIARGIGRPCVVGASSVEIDKRSHRLTTAEGRVIAEGDVVTVDGSSGRILAGPAPMLEPALDEAFEVLLGWADERRDISVRANCDTPADAEVAARFRAEGIGLCRTEHMFFEGDRLTVMREMIFAERAEDRAAALVQLLPVQRADFRQIFAIMAGRPVCIRMLDPPLYEFLPQDRAGLIDLAAALDLPLSSVILRVQSLTETNPMLGMRGVRLGIAIPEIYEMQARAIFEAAVETVPRVTPEVMIPLVSARREVDLIKTRIDAVANAVRAETGVAFDYRLGIMCETPRAALRADEITEYATFLSFGTNDLTQLTYGLSRDDAGRFMAAYIEQGVFAEDPFLRLDLDGVGELLAIGAERGRRARPDVKLSICGEHGGDPDAIAFCRRAGFDYVSCSPFRVPVARLAAAHLAIRDRGTEPGPPGR